MRLCWIIEATVRDADGERLYWSNRFGWVDKESATRFSKAEILIYHLPNGGRWVKA